MVDILLGGGLALLFGAGLSVGNYFLTKKLINRQKNTSPLAVISFLRQTFNIAYLVAIYFLSKVLPWPMEAMLIGAAIIIILRFLAAYYRWSLPRAHDLLKKQEPNQSKEETKQ